MENEQNEIDDGLARLADQMSQRPTLSIRGLTWNEINLGGVQSAVDPQSVLKKVKKRDKANFKILLNTGINAGYIMHCQGQNMMLIGDAFDNTYGHILTIQDGKLYARTKRTSHMKKLVEKLAEREGLQLIFTDSPPELVGPNKQASFWAWSNLPENLDDSAMMVTKVRSHEADIRDFLPDILVLDELPF